MQEQLELGLRLTVFVSIFGLIAVWEIYFPRRRRNHSRWQRWPSNLAVLAMNSVLARLLLPAALVGVSIAAQARGWGLFNQLQLPGIPALALTVVLMDLVIYAQHVAFHRVPLLWRLHRMHHTDRDLDVSSGGRFHPLEILVSLGIKILAVTALGAPPAGVVIFEIVLNAGASFNHGNIYVPESVDRILRWLIVTPDMHRVHHSERPVEHNSNYGFNIAWWDRLFHTYRSQPRDGHLNMRIGLAPFSSPKELRLDRMLTQPLADKHE